MFQVVWNCFMLFQVYAFWGCCRKPISSHNFTDKTNLMILFHLPWLGTQLDIRFFEFLNNKHLRSKLIFFSKNHIFCIFLLLCCMFLLERDRILKKWHVTVTVTQFPTKWCPFQPPRSKTVGGGTFLVAKSVIFQEGRKTHQNITKWTMCKISM